MSNTVKKTVNIVKEATTILCFNVMTFYDE